MYKKVFAVKVTFIEPALGSTPRNKDVFAKFIDTKRREASPDGPEVENVEDREERGWTGYLRDEKGLFVYDYTWKGFLKEAGASLREQGEHDIAALKRKVGQHIHNEPRRIYLKSDDGLFLSEEHGVLERPLRAETMQGPRVSLVRSDMVLPGTTMSFDIVTLLPDVLGEEFLRGCFERGRYVGFGQWRTASYGRFTFEMTEKSSEGSRAVAAKATRGKAKKTAPANAAPVE